MKFSKILFTVNSSGMLVCIFESIIGFSFIAFASESLNSSNGSNLLLIFFWASLFLFELPTGYIVDRLGAKLSILLSLALRAISFLIYYKSDGGLVYLIIASVLSGFAVTVMSGLFSAQVINWAKDERAEVDGKGMTKSGMLVRGSSAILGSLIGFEIVKKFNINFVWPISIAIVVIAMVHILFLWKNVKSKETTDIKSHYKSSLKHIRTQRIWGSVTKISTMRGIQVAVVTNSTVYLVPGLAKTPDKLLWLALVLGAVSLFSFKIYEIVSKRFGFVIHKSVFFVAPSLFFIDATGDHIRWAIIVVSIVLLQLGEIYHRNIFYEKLGPDNAGAISSVQGIMENGLVAIIYLATWYFVDIFGIASVWKLFAIVFVILESTSLFDRVSSKEAMGA